LTLPQARIAEDAGACAVMALERVPADIRVEGGVARMSDPKMIKEIMAAVTIPVMAKARIGHFVECQVCPGFCPLPLPIYSSAQNEKKCIDSCDGRSSKQ
jgi:pyridoxal biosynthesis lyase PdxS